MASPIILFIDDDDTDGVATFHRLTKLGFTARFHRGPFGTLAAIRDTQCHLVLLDVNMPGLDGPALIRVIRHTYNQLPVLLYSNMEKAVLDRIGRYIGADGAIVKTAADEEFGEKLREVLAEEQQRAEARQRDQRSSA
jgi:DNA-binding response OmpR family regulator